MSEEKITLRNLDRVAERHVRAADGDSIQLQPGERVEVDAKYGWNLPARVEIVKNRAIAVTSPTEAATVTTVPAPAVTNRVRAQAVPAAE